MIVTNVEKALLSGEKLTTQHKPQVGNKFLTI